MDDDFDDHFNMRLAGGNVLAYVLPKDGGPVGTVYKIRLSERVPSRRSGYGRVAMVELAAMYTVVRAVEIGADPETIKFWRRMLEEGLITEGVMSDLSPLTLSAE